MNFSYRSSFFGGDREDMFTQQLVQQGYEQLMYQNRSTKQVTEIEMEEINLRGGRIDDTGQPPNRQQEWYFSRKSTLGFVLEQLVTELGDQNNTREFRLWGDRTGPLKGSLQEDPLTLTIEEVGLKNHHEIFVEFKLESGEWPFEKKEHKGGNVRDTERTQGCSNLGNTCYMNASLQCMANSPYIREFFAKIKKPELTLEERKAIGEQELVNWSV